MTRTPPTDTERITGLREAIEAANGDWHQVTALWSVQADLDWMLSRAEKADLDAAYPATPEPTLLHGLSDDDLIAAWRETQVWQAPLSDPRNDDLKSAWEFIRRVRSLLAATPKPPALDAERSPDTFPNGWGCPCCDGTGFVSDEMADRLRAVDAFPPDAAAAPKEATDA